jgi:hypothetical protein
MRQLIFVLFLMAAMPALLVAQTPNPPAKTTSTVNDDRRMQGYVFAGPGASSRGSETLLNFGGGGEGFIKGGLSVGAEVGGIAPSGQIDNGLGIFSANVGYHFRKASQSRKVVPFVSGGYTLFFRSGVDNGVNFGGGVNYWFKDRLGLRFEVRDHVFVPSPDTHLIGFRVGLMFR